MRNRFLTIILSCILFGCAQTNKESIQYTGNFFNLNFQKGDSIHFYKLDYNNNKWKPHLKPFYYPYKKLVLNSFLDEIAIQKDSVLQFYSYTNEEWKYEKNNDFVIPENDKIIAIDKLTLGVIKSNTLYFYSLGFLSNKWKNDISKRFEFEKDAEILVFDDKTLGVLKNNEISFYDYTQQGWVASTIIPILKLQNNDKIISYGLMYIATLNKKGTTNCYIFNLFADKPSWDFIKDVKIE